MLSILKLIYCHRCGGPGGPERGGMVVSGACLYVSSHAMDTEVESRLFVLFAFCHQTFFRLFNEKRMGVFPLIGSSIVSYLASEVIYGLTRAGSIGCFWLAFETMFNFIWPMKFNLRHLSYRDWINSALNYYICLLMLCCYINNIFRC